MVKRSTQCTDGAAAFRKRQKLTQNTPTGELVTSSEQLQQLLTFDQDMRNAHHGLQSFKRLLDDIISCDDDRKQKLAILQGYLESIKPRDTSEEAVHLRDIMEMWSFSIQVNDEGVMSFVAIVLALVLQVLSESLHLVPFGLGICQTLVQESQLKCISRNLGSEKGKGFIISPTLRLLREAVSFDGGAFAKKIVRARIHTLTSLGRNMEIGHVRDAQEGSRKASVRTNAIRFFLSCLKYLHSEGRRELLSQRDLLSHLTYMMKNDPPDLVIDIMESLKANVLADGRIAREIKFKAFNTKILMRVLSLYSYSNPTANADEKDLVCEKAHQLLTFACTTPSAGILYPYKGLYPKEAEDEFSALSRGNKNNEANGDPWEGRLPEGVPVYNFALSEFIGKLRPWSNLKHCELLVAIFGAAPELISDYFFNSQSFTFEPKLTMTWVGYAAFLLNTMMIPLRASFGDPSRYAVMPPPTSVLLDNIIPRPINQKVLIRCLSQKSHLTSFFATRILVAALEKLSAALGMLDGRSRRRNAVWMEASRRLVDMFCQKIPDMKELVRCYKTIPAENILHRTLTSRLLRLYYEVVPRVALAANFDVSTFFTSVLADLGRDSVEAEPRELGLMELENLVLIASYSPGMRWFVKHESVGHGYASSPFNALLQLLCSDEEVARLGQLKTILGDVAVESQVVTRPADLKTLLQALRCARENLGSAGMETVWSFLDNCVNRCANSPIKYLDLMKDYSSKPTGSESGDSTSLLNVAIMDQLPYVLDAGDEKVAHQLATFVSFFFNATWASSRDSVSMERLHRQVANLFSRTSASFADLGNTKQVKALEKHDGIVWTMRQPIRGGEEEADGVTFSQASLEEMLHVPLPFDEDATVLAKWASKSVEDMIEDGWAAGLARLLASEHMHLRKEALTGILKMAAQIKDSAYEEKMQIWLLLSEVAESSRAQVDSGPVPSAFTAFTVHALEVLKNPLHPLYPKVNSYLTRSPVWGLDKLPMVHDILHGTPSEDDKYYTELSWLLDYLLDGLRNPLDLGIFHKKRWFEKIFALGSNPYLRSALRTRLLKLVYRATCIETGSTTLVTRFGILSWLDSQRVCCDVDETAAVYAALIKRVWETCDEARVRGWSKGGVDEYLEKTCNEQRTRERRGIK
ncbi:Ribosome 60S biogenesis [Metarhizium album ARSEF 1941]|uniref:Ribosome 60S biogenesis n=1 Tax=Metarhizium album (strain ARSEF 1941) TaxID=1081103 RepID=A0A0B2WUY6_METAS|nr:Ribosome 60S biogenesis [Metarhizium album ARSEF 1941]KHN97888.1 Ribosome 60S biogenesis [Metarhizium album ARSEF 1941]